MSQAVQRLEVSALFITTRTVGNAFLRWHNHARNTRNILTRFRRIARRFEACHRKRRLHSTLRRWKAVASAYRMDLEGRRVHAHQHAVSRLALQQRFFRTLVGRDRCRQLFSKWRCWLLKRKNARLTAQLRKLRVNHRQDQQAEENRRMRAAIRVITSSFCRVECIALSRAFGRWRLVAKLMQQHQLQAEIQAQRRDACLRSMVLRQHKIIQARAWGIWIKFCSRAVAKERHVQMAAELVNRDRRLQANREGSQRALMQVYLKRCSNTYARVRMFWLSKALHRWMSMVQTAQNSK